MRRKKSNKRSREDNPDEEKQAKRVLTGNIKLVGSVDVEGTYTSNPGILPMDKPQFNNIHTILREKIRAFMMSPFCQVCKKEFLNPYEADWHFHNSLIHIKNVLKWLWEEKELLLDDLKKRGGLQADLNNLNCAEDILQLLIFPGFCYMCWKYEDKHYKTAEHRRKVDQWKCNFNNCVPRNVINNPNNLKLLQNVNKKVLYTTFFTKINKEDAFAYSEAHRSHADPDQDHDGTNLNVSEGDTTIFMNLKQEDSELNTSIEKDSTLLTQVKGENTYNEPKITKTDKNEDLVNFSVKEENFNHDISEDGFLENDYQVFTKQSENTLIRTTHVFDRVVSQIKENQKDNSNHDCIKSFIQCLQTVIQTSMNNNFCQICGINLPTQTKTKKHCIEDEHIVNVSLALIQYVERGKNYLLRKELNTDINWISVKEEFLKLMKTPMICCLCWQGLSIDIFHIHYETIKHQKRESKWNFLLDDIMRNADDSEWLENFKIQNVSKSVSWHQPDQEGSDITKSTKVKEENSFYESSNSKEKPNQDLHNSLEENKNQELFIRNSKNTETQQTSTEIIPNIKEDNSFKNGSDEKFVSNAENNWIPEKATFQDKIDLRSLKKITQIKARKLESLKKKTQKKARTLRALIKSLNKKIGTYMTDSFCRICNEALGENQAKSHCRLEDHIRKVCKGLIKEGKQYLLQRGLKVDNIDWSTTVLDLTRSSSKCFICWSEVSESNQKCFNDHYKLSKKHQKRTCMWKYFLNGKNLKDISKYVHNWEVIESSNAELSKEFPPDLRATFLKRMSVFSCKICKEKLQFSAAWRHYQSREHAIAVKKWYKHQQKMKFKKAGDNNANKTKKKKLEVALNPNEEKTTPRIRVKKLSTLQ